MAILLHIDTASSHACISLSLNGVPVHAEMNNNQQEHAGFIQPAIQRLLTKTGYQISQLEAIAVVEGPGSYTGLRVGMASAKGMCFALNIPMITIGSLPLIASALSKINADNCLLCPMIDARRMEVFTALYDSGLKELMSPCAMILDTGSFEYHLKDKKILFTGDGSLKWKTLTQSSNAAFADESGHLEEFNKMGFNKFLASEFANITFSEPLYVKSFHH